jgi:hypothetical protein
MVAIVGRRLPIQACSRAMVSVEWIIDTGLLKVEWIIRVPN